MLLQPWNRTECERISLRHSCTSSFRSKPVYLFLDVLRNVLLNAELFEGSLGNVNGLLLHFVALRRMSIAALCIGLSTYYHVRRLNLSWNSVSRLNLSQDATEKALPSSFSFFSVAIPAL